MSAPAWVPLHPQRRLYYETWAVAGAAFLLSALLVLGQFGRALQPGPAAGRLIPRRRRRLGPPRPAAGGIEQRDIRESSPDIDPGDEERSVCVAVKQLARTKGPHPGESVV